MLPSLLLLNKVVHEGQSSADFVSYWCSRAWARAEVGCWESWDDTFGAVRLLTNTTAWGTKPPDLPQAVHCHTVFLDSFVMICEVVLPWFHRKRAILSHCFSQLRIVVLLWFSLFAFHRFHSDYNLKPCRSALSRVCSPQEVFQSATHTWLLSANFSKCLAWFCLP